MSQNSDQTISVSIRAEFLLAFLYLLRSAHDEAICRSPEYLDWYIQTVEELDDGVIEVFQIMLPQSQTVLVNAAKVKRRSSAS